MARITRITYPGAVYHVCQRGNRRQKIFFTPEDYSFYLSLLKANSVAYRVLVAGYSLMPNHVHLVLRPEAGSCLSNMMASTSATYARLINKREEWTGCLWQGRFHSNPCEDESLLRLMAYVELNPVRASLVSDPSDWPWSSAKAHILGEPDPVLTEPWPIPPSDWGSIMRAVCPDVDLIRKRLMTGRPLGSSSFVSRLESATGLVLQARRPGPRLGSRAAYEARHGETDLPA